MNFDALSHVMKTKYVFQVLNITMIPQKIAFLIIRSDGSNNFQLLMSVSLFEGKN